MRMRRIVGAAGRQLGDTPTMKQTSIPRSNQNTFHICVGVEERWADLGRSAPKTWVGGERPVPPCWHAMLHQG